MSQARSMNGYAVAGCQFASEDHFHVCEQVYVPDGDAGTECASCFQGEKKARHGHKGPATVTVRSALIFLSVLIGICGFSLTGKLHARKEMSLKISGMQQNVAAIQMGKEESERQVQLARDSSRVCYIAVHEYGMMAPESTDIRYFSIGPNGEIEKLDPDKENLSAAQELPLVSGQAQLTGSR